MGTIQILLGKTRGRRRTAINRNWLTGLDPAGRPNFLYLTDTTRKRDLVESDYVRYRRGASFAPEVATVSGLLADLVRRFGDGRIAWEPLGVELVAERLLTTRGGEFPWLARLGRHAAGAAAALHGVWDEAGQPALPGLRGPLVEPFLRALHATLASDARALPMGDALRALLPRLARPTDALASWLGRPHAVVLDDVLHPSPLRREVLVALARAWRDFGAHVLLCFESGRDLGGAEVGRFFEYDDEHAVAFSLRPFAATRSWRRHLFATLVAEGGEADIVLARADGGLQEIDGAESVEPADAPDLADRLHVRLPGPTDMGPVRLVRHADPAAEARSIGHEVKARLRAGADPGDLWVAFPGLPGWIGIVGRTFDELGIPYQVSRGTPLGSLPIAAWVRALARLAGDGFPAEGVLAVLGAPLVGVLRPGEAWALGRWVREQGRRSLPPGDWSGPAEPCPLSPERQAELTAALAPLQALAGPVTATTWRDTLLERVGAWGVVERVEAGTAHGDGPAMTLAARTLAALGVALDAVTRVAAAAWSASDGPWPPERLATALDDALDRAGVPDHPIGGARVSVVGMLELRGIHPPHLWIGGLVADDFPPPPKDDWLLPRAERAPLDEADPTAEARYLLASALRNATAQEGSLTLSWSAARGGRPLAVSPLVEDLLEIPLGDDPGAPTLRSRIEVSAEVSEPPWSADEVDELVARLDAEGRPTDGWAVRDPDRIAELREALVARRDRTTFGRFDGILPAPPPAPSRLPATALEQYLRCPAAFFFGRVLALRPEELWEADLPAATRGSLLHQVLHRFLTAAKERGWERLEGVDDAASRALLHEAALAVLEDDARSRLLPEGLAAWHRARWLGGLVDDLPQGLLHAWLDAERASTWGRVPYQTEWPIPPLPLGPLVIEGRIDRVDRLDDGGLLVIDYKTGAAPSAARVRTGLAVQGLLYLHALDPDGEGAAVFQELKGPTRLAWAGWAGSPDVVGRLAPRVRSALRIDAAERGRHRDAWQAGAERLAAGRFHPTLADPEAAGCGFCPYRTICRVDVERNAAIAALGDPRWQAPLSPPPEAT